MCLLPATVGTRLLKAGSNRWTRKKCLTPTNLANEWPAILMSASGVSLLGVVPEILSTGIVRKLRSRFRVGSNWKAHQLDSGSWEALGAFLVCLHGWGWDHTRINCDRN